MVTKSIWFPAVGLVEFHDDGTATLEERILSPGEKQEYEKILDEYTEVVSSIPICNTKPW